MAFKLHPKDVADAFVRQYYAILDRCPENLYKFYQETSLLGWPGSDGAVTPVTTLVAINEMIMASDHKNGTIEVKTVDAQESLGEAVIVAVMGMVTASDGKKKYFSQTFFLAKQAKGFFVLNDLLRVIDIPSSITNADANHNGVKDQAAGNAASLVEDVEHPVAEDTDAKGPVSTPLVVSPKKSLPVSLPTLNVTPKVTYASMVAKKRPPSPAKPSLVTVNVRNQTKLSAPQASPTTKASTASSAASKELASPTKAAPKSPKAGNGAPNASVHGDTKGIYIGRLPHEITKQGIIDVVKHFGHVKRTADSVQIRRHEDGFTCAFVEFESAESARHAVEAHHVRFGDKDRSESYISYKRSSRGTDGGRRSPTKAGSRNSSSSRRDSETSRKGRPQHDSQTRVVDHRGIR